MNHFQYIYIPTIALFLLTAPFVHAQTNITNSISVKAHSGGNTVQNGETIEGSSTSTVDIVTRSGDEVVHEVHETKTGSNTQVEYSVHAENDTVTITNEQIEVREENTYAPEKTTTQATTEAAIQTGTTDIINLSEAPEESVNATEQTHETHTSFFARISSAVSNTFAYVLSIFFS